MLKLLFFGDTHKSRYLSLPPSGYMPPGGIRGGWSLGAPGDKGAQPTNVYGEMLQGVENTPTLDS